MIKAIIFDMDGLMIDSERVTCECYKKYLAKMGLEITEEFYIQLLGRTAAACKEKFLKQYGEEFPYEDSVKTVHRMMAEQFLEEGIPLKKGLKELLKYLKKNNYKTIVATSSERKRVDDILKNAGLTQYFDASICGDEVQNGKPHPEVFLKACEKLGVSTQEALVLEDSEAGIRAAFDGGIEVICVPDMKYPGDDYKRKVTFLCNDLADVKTYIEEYCQ